MILYTVVSLLTIMLASMVRTTSYRASRQRMLNIVSVAAIFAILTILAALRLEVGNDYGNYVTTCHEIFQHGYVVTEPGFNTVVRILYTLSGSENYLLMFGVFGAGIVAVFLMAFLKLSDSFAWSVMLFMSLGIYFRSFNTVRYYFVLALTLMSLKLVAELYTPGENGEKGCFNWQKLFWFLVLVLVAATFHKSVLVVIPFYLFSRLPWKKWMYLVVLLGTVVVFLLHQQIFDLALKLYPSYQNTEYIKAKTSIMEYAPAIGRCVLVLILCIVCYKEAIERRTDNRLYFNMNILAIALYVGCYWLPLVSRLGYYLMTAHLLLVPNIICSIEDKRKKKIVMMAVVGFAIIYYVYFLRTAGRVGIRVLPYRSWLFDTADWLDQTDIFDWGGLVPIDREWLNQ